MRGRRRGYAAATVRNGFGVASGQRAGRQEFQRMVVRLIEDRWIGWHGIGWP
jgi:hypothetical protein